MPYPGYWRLEVTRRRSLALGDELGCHAYDTHDSCATWYIAEKPGRRGAEDCHLQEEFRLEKLVSAISCARSWTLALRKSRAASSNLPKSQHLSRSFILLLNSNNDGSFEAFASDDCYGRLTRS